MTEYEKMTKHKMEKPQMALGLIHRFPLACAAVAQLSAHGAEKRGIPMEDMSYQFLGGAETMFLDAEIRHAIAEAIEGTIDRESGFPHKVHKLWNAFADLEVFLSVDRDEYPETD